MFVIFPVESKLIYEAWLDSQKHTEMTGSKAEIDAVVGGEFYAWDGYISGTTLELRQNQRIVQAWRTSEFPADVLDSKVEIRLTDVKDQCHLTLIHTNIPEGQTQMYKDGWEEFYFKPMKKYFKEN